MTAIPDAELVRRCLDGEESAWAALTARYADLVYGIARRHGLSSDVAGDVVQEVFLGLLTHLKRLRRTDRLLAWLVRASRRESWRQVRRARARRKREETVSRPDGAGTAEPSTDLSDHELRQTVREAYASLGERCRRLLDALFLGPVDTPYTQVAKDLDLAVGSIGSLRKRCLEALKVELERLGLGARDLP